MQAPASFTWAQLCSSSPHTVSLASCLGTPQLTPRCRTLLVFQYPKPKRVGELAPHDMNPWTSGRQGLLDSPGMQFKWLLGELVHGIKQLFFAAAGSVMQNWIDSPSFAVLLPSSLEPSSWDFTRHYSDRTKSLAQVLLFQGPKLRHSVAKKPR